MKMKKKFSKLTLLVFALFLFILLALPAQADIYSTKAVAFTNTAASSTNGPFYNNASTNLFTTLATGATLTVNSDPIPIRQGGGLALLPQFTSTNAAATENVTNFFDVGVLVGGSAGTTNWTTTHPIKYVSALNGTNTVVDLDILDTTEIDNVAFIRWAAVAVQAGHTNAITIQPIQASYSQYAK
jgi:hypothetical protein